MNTNKRSLLAIGLLAFMSIPLAGCNGAAAPNAPAPVMTPAPVAVAVAPAPAYRAPAPRCYDCGKVASIETMKRKGEANGTGAVIGAIIGGVVGHQFGNGKGNTAATAGGAIVGGVAGHQIEKQVKKETFYHVVVMMTDGAVRTVDVDELNGLAVGAKVRVNGNTIVLS